MEMRIHAPQVSTGNVGDDYDATTGCIQTNDRWLYIRTQKQLPDNGTGVLSDQAQAVTYVYTKEIPVKAADVTGNMWTQEWNWRSTHHKSLQGMLEMTTTLQQMYTNLTISGYTLDTKQLPTNSTGTM